MNKFTILTIVLFIYSINILCNNPKIVKITVEPKEAAIYIDNVFAGYGYAEFPRPKKKDQVSIIRCESNEYKTIYSKFYGGDKRSSLSYSLQQDGFYRASASSGIVNKFFTIDIADNYYTVENDQINVQAAWKLIHQILLNYFDEIATTDYSGGYLQTPWQYKSFTLSEKQIRNRVTIRDISTLSRIAFQIKISSEVAGVMAARHGEFTEIDRIPKEFEPLIQELQTRIGKVSNI